MGFQLKWRHVGSSHGVRSETETVEPPHGRKFYVVKNLPEFRLPPVCQSIDVALVRTINSGQSHRGLSC